MNTVDPDEIARFLASYDAIVDHQLTLEEYRANASKEQREADAQAVVRRGAPVVSDEYSSLFDNEGN